MNIDELGGKQVNRLATQECNHHHSVVYRAYTDSIGLSLYPIKTPGQ